MSVGERECVRLESRKRLMSLKGREIGQELPLAQGHLTVPQ